MSITAINNLSGEKKIILALVIFLISSIGFLFYSEKKQLGSANAGWEIYFKNPQSTDLTFTIKNAGKSKKLHWKEFEEGSADTLREADIFISAGQENTIPLSDAGTSEGEKIILEVSDEAGNKKEIYKLFN
jgi:hypothetical protein